MAKSRITFTDTFGAATLQSDYPEPASRFANWTPSSAPVGAAAHVLADETMYRFRTSWRYGASFDVVGLKMGAASGSSYDLADRLVAHLLNGGSCSVYTEDKAASTYLICGLMPGTQPSLRQTDRSIPEYALSLALINLAAAPARMVCFYGV